MCHEPDPDTTAKRLLDGSQLSAESTLPNHVHGLAEASLQVSAVTIHNCDQIVLLQSVLCTCNLSRIDAATHDPHLVHVN